MKIYKSDPNHTRYGVRVSGERGTFDRWFDSAADRADWLDVNDVDVLGFGEPRVPVEA